MTLHSIKDILNQIAPLDIQDDWDNSGMQVCTGHKDIKKILIALEINNAVIDEAIAIKADMILTHHPLLFEGVKKICPCSPCGEYIIKLVKNDIAVYASHTPFDKIKDGNNEYFLKELGLKGIKKINDYVRVGSLERTITLSSFAKKVAKFSSCEGMIRVVGEPNKKIKKVGICTGAGADMYKDAKDAGADVFITGDIKHHLAQNAKDEGMCLIDALHYGTEKQFVDNMHAMLSKKIGKQVKLVKTKVNQNPFDFTV